LKNKILCSACLLGIKCKYDGNTNTNKKVLKLNEKEILIPVCPEQLGGLTTPRNPAELIGNSVFTKTGTNVTDSFIKGAQQTLKTAQIFGCKKAILKQRSPSCGCGQIYDGTFSGKVIKGEGITAKLLRENGIEVISEEDID
jgi:uncharacterized protein YbbK (DUF523 family)